MKWPLIWKALFILVVIMLVGHSVYRERWSAYCPSCLAHREVVIWAIGRPPDSSWTVRQSTRYGEPTIAQRDLFDDQHQHRWATGRVTLESLFGGGMLLHSHPPYNRFVVDYENDADFREFVHSKIRSDSLSKEQAQRLAEFEQPEELYGKVPMYPPEDRIPPPPTLSASDKELLLLGWDLFDEYCEGEPPQGWWWWN